MSRKPTSSPADEASLAAASERLARLLSSDTPEEERRAAELWAAQSPQNARAWAQVNELWRELGAAAADPRVAAMRARAQDIAQRSRTR